MTMATITVQRESGTPLRCTAPAKSLMADFPSLRKRYGNAAKLAKASERGERIVVAEPGENCEKYGSCGIMGSVALAGSRAARRPHRMSTPAPSRSSPPPPPSPPRSERLGKTSTAAGGACKCSTTTPAPPPPMPVDLSDGNAIWDARADVRACFSGDRKSAWLRFHRDNNCNGRECLRQLGIDPNTASPPEELSDAEKLWRDRADLRNCFARKQTWLTFHKDCSRCGDDPLAKLGLRK